MSLGKVIVLGCGNSAGTPAIGNDWGKCDPAEPKNRRRRACIHLSYQGRTLLVDTGPDLKDQINSSGIDLMDAVLYTHCHADHVMGIDDLRSWVARRERTMPVYMDLPTYTEMVSRFDYLIHTQSGIFYPLVLKPHVLDEQKIHTPIEIEGMPVTLFTQSHGEGVSLGVRVGDFAYSTDMLDLSDRAVECLRGVRTWLVDGAAYHQKTPPIHANLETVYRLNERVGAARVVIHHMPRNIDYQTLRQELPPGYEPAYDGMEIEIDS